MDLKALIAKMDQIENKKILNEGFPTVADAKARAEKEKTTGKFDRKETSTGTVYTRKSSTFDDGGKDSDQKKAEKKSKKNESFNFKEGGLAHQLLSEFDLAEKVTLPADGSTPNVQTVNGVTQNAPSTAAPATAAPGSAGTTTPEDFKFTPEQEKWLGGADRQDPNILARMPGPKPPVTYFKDPANQAIAKKLNFGQENLNKLKSLAGIKPEPATFKADSGMATDPSSANAVNGSDLASDQAAAAKAPAMTAADRDDAEMGAAMRANAAGGNSTSAATGVGNPGEEAAAQAAADKKAATSYDSFGNPVAAGSAAATSADPTGLAQAQQDVNKAAPAAAGGKTEWPTDKAGIIAFQKANNLVPDGLIGAKTMAALQKAGATPPAGFKPVANKASGQAGQPAAAASLGGKSFKDASAAANAAAGQAAQPAGNPEANQTAATAARTGVAGTAAAGGGRGAQGGPTVDQLAQKNSEVEKIDAEIKRFSSKNNMTLQANKDYVARLEKKKAAVGGTATAAAPAAAGQAAQPAAKPAAKPGELGSGTYQMNSVQSIDDAILERIRNILK